MSKQNIQVQNSLLSSIPKNANDDNNEQITQEINNLKNIVLQLEKRHLAVATKRTDPSPLKLQKQSEQDQLNSKIVKRQEQSRIRFGPDFYSDIKQRFKTRMHHKKISVINETQQTAVNKRDQKNGEEDKSIIYLSQDYKKGDNFILTPNNLDPEEDQPAKTQFFQPAPRTHSNPVEFHFKKPDLIPVIEQDHKRFTSYLKTQRQRQHNNRYRINSQSNSKSGSFSCASQPQLESKKDPTANYIANRFPEPAIDKDSSKQQLIAYGKLIFKHFLPLFDTQAKFSIKKYKNCIIFSLMPEVTKGMILYYNEEVYFGNISANEKGKIQKNGPGFQYLPGKHFYEGHFINGRKNGKGKITHKNGDQYEGQWSDGEINGFGTFIARKSNERYQGFWKYGEYCGNLVNAKFLTAKIG